eukprot:COSAG01_NODE_10116_length_2247_cov_1.790037_4_plen_63_part_00
MRRSSETSECAGLSKILCAGRKVALVSLMSASLPYSFYNVRLGVNDALAIDGQTPVKLPPQN